MGWLADVEDQIELKVISFPRFIELQFGVSALPSKKGAARNYI
jgi:hypothetical protein